MFNQGNILYLMSLSILITCLLMYGCYREKLHVHHFWELTGDERGHFSIKEGAMGRKRGSLLAVNVQREGRAQSLSKLITNVNVTRTVITQEKIVIPLKNSAAGSS